MQFNCFREQSHAQEKIIHLTERCEKEKEEIRRNHINTITVIRFTDMLVFVVLDSLLCLTVMHLKIVYLSPTASSVNLTFLDIAPRRRNV